MKFKKIASLFLACALRAGLRAGCGGTGGAVTPAPGGDNGGAAAADWPKENINFMITHSAGGDTDYNARLLGRLLQEKLGVTVVSTNVTGSNGSICMTQYKDGTPDGYTFVLTNTAALSGNEATGLSDFGYDAFEPVCIYGKQSGENIVVPADSPYNTLQELVDAAKAAPGSIRFGISTGGGVYIESVIMQQATDNAFNIIDTGDAADRLASLLGGQTDVSSLPYATASEYIEAGQLKSLCTVMSQSPDLLDQPSASETIPDLVMDTLYVVLAPKGTPAEVVEAMNAAILDVVNNSAEYKEEVNSFNFQNPWALSVADTVAELDNQRTLFMSYSDLLQG